MAKDYGGAYDVNPEEYWTKDDLMALKDAIEDENSAFKIKAIYLAEGDVLDIEYEAQSHGGWDGELQSQIKIDRRIAGNANDLCLKYAPIVRDAIEHEIKDVENELAMEEEEEWQI